MPISSVSGRGSRASASSSVATIGMSRPGRIDETLPPGLGRVDDRPDVVRPVADHADGGLAVVEAEVALGEDDEAARGGGRDGQVGHAAECTGGSPVNVVR